MLMRGCLVDLQFNNFHGNRMGFAIICKLLGLLITQLSVAVSCARAFIFLLHSRKRKKLTRSRTATVLGSEHVLYI